MASGKKYQGGPGTQGGPARSTGTGFGTLGGLGTIGNMTTNTLQRSILKFLASMNAYKPAQAPKVKKPTSSSSSKSDMLGLGLTTFSKYLRDRQQHKNVKRDHSIAGQNMRDYQKTTNDLIVLNDENKAAKGINLGTGSKTQAEIMIDQRKRSLRAAGTNRREKRRRWHSQRVGNFFFG